VTTVHFIASSIFFALACFGTAALSLLTMVYVTLIRERIDRTRSEKAWYKANMGRAEEENARLYAELKVARERVREVEKTLKAFTYAARIGL
jgi:threonine aldolase